MFVKFKLYFIYFFKYQVASARQGVEHMFDQFSFLK